MAPSVVLARVAAQFVANRRDAATGRAPKDLKKSRGMAAV
jgi:hypothetical protein